MTESAERRRRDIAVAVVPARWSSTRLPGKPLAMVAGRPLIAHVVENLRRCRTLQSIVVATDDVRIRDAANAVGAVGILTSPHHVTGTDRIVELLPQIESAWILNVQGDEPEVDPAAIDRLVSALVASRDVAVATLAAPLAADLDPESLNSVKVVVDGSGRALYFSRSPIPAHPTFGEPTPRRLHLGVYAFRRDALAAFATLPRGPLERSENLEQLRFLEHGWPILVVDVDAPTTKGIDTPEDLESFRVRVGRRTGEIRRE